MAGGLGQQQYARQESNRPWKTLGSEDRSNACLPKCTCRCPLGSTGAVQTILTVSPRVVGVCQGVPGFGYESTFGTVFCCPFCRPPYSYSHFRTSVSPPPCRVIHKGDTTVRR